MEITLLAFLSLEPYLAVMVLVLLMVTNAI